MAATYKTDSLIRTRITNAKNRCKNFFLKDRHIQLTYYIFLLINIFPCF